MNTQSLRFFWLPGLIAALLFGTTGCSGGELSSTSANSLDAYAQSLYNSQVQYIGDNSAVGSLLSQLGVSNRMGTFNMELQTSTEPYELTLHFDQAPEDASVFTDQFHYYADLLLALIDNCGQVNCTYSDPDGQGDETLHWTIQDANDTLALDIKTCTDDADGVHTLLNTIREKNQNNATIMAFYGEGESH